MKYQLFYSSFFVPDKGDGQVFTIQEKETGLRFRVENGTPRFSTHSQDQVAFSQCHFHNNTRLDPVLSRITLQHFGIQLDRLSQFKRLDRFPEKNPLKTLPERTDLPEAGIAQPDQAEAAFTVKSNIGISFALRESVNDR